MQMPQQNPIQGAGMPTRGPGGGWHMPPMAPRPQAPQQAPQAPPQAPPMMGQQPPSFSPAMAQMLQALQGFGSGYGGDYGGWGNVGSVGHDSGMGYSAGY
jgi:hypothetical protein